MILKKKEAIDKVRFVGRHNSKKGIIALIIGIINICLLISVSVLLSQHIIDDNMLIGLYGFTILTLSGLGLYIGYESTKEKDIFYGYPITSVIINGLTFIILITLYLIGTVI